nr:putative allantoinase 1 [Quercus suber]
MASAPLPLPPISTLPNLPIATLITMLDLLFEPSPELHALALPILTTTRFPSYTALISALQTHLQSLQSPSPQLDAILSSHPRLGAPKVASAQSAAEQARLQQGGAPGEAKQLQCLNEEYEATFPGLRYVVFVNGRGRDEIMRDMRARIAGSTGEQERRSAVEVSHRGLFFFSEGGGGCKVLLATTHMQAATPITLHSFEPCFSFSALNFTDVLKLTVWGM